MKTIQLLLAFMLAITGITPAWSQFNPVQQQALHSKDYAVNGGFESGLANWKTYQDASGAQPVDCSGGTPSVGLASSTIGAIAPKASGVITKPTSNVQGEGYALSFTLDKAARTKPITITGSYEISSGTYSGGSSSTDSDLVLYIYDVDGNQIIQPAGYKLDGGVINNTYDITATFQSPHFTTNSRNFRLCLHHATTSASAFLVRVDQIKIQVPSKSQGAAITEWKDFPSVAAGTFLTAATGSNPTYGNVLNNTAKYRWVGGNLELEWDFRQSTAGTAGSGGIYLINLQGTGCTIDTTLKPAVTSTTVSSVADWQASSVGWMRSYNPTNSGTGSVHPYSSTQLRASIAYDTTEIYWSSSNFHLGEAVGYFVKASVPCVGKGSSQTLSSETDTRTVSFSGYVSSGAALTANVTNLPLTLEKDSHGAWSGSTYVVPVPGDYIMGGQFLSASGAATINAYLNGSLYKRFSYANTANWFSGNILLPNLKAGDIISIRSDSSMTIFGGASTAASNVFITRLSGPSQIAASETVAARYYISAGASTTSGTPFNYDTKDFDSHSAVTTGAGVWKFTAPVAGFYEVSAVSYSGTMHAIEIWKNASKFAVLSNNDTGNQMPGSGTSLIYLKVTDYVDIRPNVTVTPGGTGTSAVNFVNHINIRKVGN